MDSHYKSNELAKTTEIQRYVVFGEFAVFPNHFHRILHIVGNRHQENDRRKGRPAGRPYETEKPNPLVRL
jgi:hypothetical protein